MKTVVILSSSLDKVTMGSNSHLVDSDMPFKPAGAGEEDAGDVFAQCVGSVVGFLQYSKGYSEIISVYVIYGYSLRALSRPKFR